MISLKDVENVKQFVQKVEAFPYDFDLTQGRYIVDAKSLLGVLSLDLGSPVAMTVHTSDDISDLLESIASYIS
jgi:phosphotransferase system HPr-like phosphotransfer protein